MSELDSLLGGLVLLGERKEELQAATGRIVTAKSGLEVSRQNLALLQAELQGRAEAIADYERHIAEQEKGFREDAEGILESVAQWRTEEAERRQNADEQALDIEYAAKELLGEPDPESGEGSDDEDDGDDDGAERQGSDNG
jgi:hypothetical protein